MDGVTTINNVLIIGMTNRLDMLDSALLRPGRFEVQVEIHLPDRAGRLQIFRIHTSKLTQALQKDVNLNELSDLTPNFSGAEIEGVVKAAMSFAQTRMINPQAAVNGQSYDLGELKLFRKDFIRGIKETNV